MINKTKIAKFNFTIFTILLTPIMQVTQAYRQEPELIFLVHFKVNPVYASYEPFIFLWFVLANIANFKELFNP